MKEEFKEVKGINKVNREEWFEMVEEGQRRTRQNMVVNVRGGGAQARSYKEGKIPFGGPINLFHSESGRLLE